MSSRPPEPPYDRPGRRDVVDERGRRFDPRDDYDVEESDRVVVRRRPPLWVILAGLVALVLVGFFVVNLARSGPGEDRVDGNGATAANDSGGNATATAAADPAARCASRQTYDGVKAELFRLAAATRGHDQATFDRLASYATLRMESPVLKSQDGATGALACSGRASIDLPPGLVVAGGRTTLSAPLDYTLQNAADGSGQVITLAGADPITVPLATLARTGETPATSESGSGDATAPDAGSLDEPGVAPSPIAPTPQPLPVPRAATPPPAPTPPQASSDPGFNCRYARTRGEIAVCNDDGLALLDRRMTSVYVDALRNASSTQYALLHQTRDRFLGYRDRCANSACMAAAYRDRIREISDIMAGRWQP
ncbi:MULTISPECIES: lysozyme inhibitor LprI family protein [Sphingomonas]|uniref:lysozyme inhibitor LprI family protein n=1 Tax=Sphingomonas TaxID=13687 RepID=UPI000DEF8025|nr:MULTISPECIES: hypothetical protein [Sphingomonas]